MTSIGTTGNYIVNTLVLFFYDIKKFSDNGTLPPTATHLADATFLQQGKLYSWLDKWTLARGRDCLYLWSSAVAIELSHGSNGWFRYILDGKLSTMYSSGTPEGGNDTNGELCDRVLTPGKSYQSKPCPQSSQLMINI